jgi:hypothetical protein
MKKHRQVFLSSHGGGNPGRGRRGTTGRCRRSLRSPQISREAWSKTSEILRFWGLNMVKAW